MIEELGGKESSFDEFKNTKKQGKTTKITPVIMSIPFIHAGLSGRSVSKSLHERERLPNEISHVDRPLHRAAELDKDSFLMQASRLTFSYEMRPKRTSD
jgi:hypothetical protein